MPQTRFVLGKALAQNLNTVIVVNKVDRPDARIAEVVDEILLLLMDLGATDAQLDSPMVFTSGRDGTASYSPDVPGENLTPLFETILQYVRPPEGDAHIDRTGKASGRGAYICPEVSCLKKAQKARTLERALETSIEPAVFEQLEREIARRDL